jgi:hypothetical protein
VSTHARKPCRGTVAYFIARLDREYPDLAALVRDGELTAASAAIKAGYLKPRMALPKDPEAAATAILRRWGPDCARRFAVLLTEMAESWTPRDSSRPLDPPIPSKEADGRSKKATGRLTRAAGKE